MNPNTPPPDGPTGAQGAPQHENDPSGAETANGAQAGAQGFPAPSDSCPGFKPSGLCQLCGDDWRWHATPAPADLRDQIAAAVRAWLPALRRAVDCLDTTCRYHGDRLDPDRFGRMTRSEACCDTGIEPRRAREARAALDALTALAEHLPPSA
jgi:formylglycine-generating enzyme required for sulfatase activity